MKYSYPMMIFINFHCSIKISIENVRNYVKFLSSNFNHGNNVYHINLEQKQKICLFFFNFYFWAFSFFQTYISEFIDCYNIIRTRKTKQKKRRRIFTFSGVFFFFPFVFVIIFLCLFMHTAMSICLFFMEHTSLCGCN
jgi:hypothetical protein